MQTPKCFWYCFNKASVCNFVVYQCNFVSVWLIFVIVWGNRDLDYWRLIFYQGQIKVSHTGSGAHKHTRTPTHTETSHSYQVWQITSVKNKGGTQRKNETCFSFRVCMCVCACHYSPFLLPSSPATAEPSSVVTCSCFRLKFWFSYTRSRKRFKHQTCEILRSFFGITADFSADVCLSTLIIVFLELKENTKWWCLHCVGLMGWLSKASLTLWKSPVFIL